MHPTQIREYFEKRSESMVRAIIEIVDIESPSGATVQNRQVADWIERYVSGISADVAFERTRADAYGEHLVIRAFPNDAKAVLILGHTDTVHPIGSSIKNPTRIEGGKLYGCGAFDMKANIVLALETLRYFFENGERPAYPITILLSCDEEVGSFTGREHVEREAAGAAFCLVCEPSSGGRVKTGRKGTGIFTVTAHGIPAHAGLEPEKGANAISELARQIEKISAIGDTAKGTTVNVCTVKGGTTTNVIPEYAECSVDVRFSAADEAERVESSMRALASADARVSLSVTGGINRPPLERNADVAALFEKARSIAASFDYELGETQVGGASDGNFVAALGIPLLDGVGVSGGGAHTFDEYIYIDDIAKRATLLTAMLMS